MGILKNLTDEYFGEIERDEDIIEGVNRVSFTDGNGKFHKNGYQPENRGVLIKLMEMLIRRRGNEGDFNDVDTSLITSMSFLFMDSKFNGDISGWKFPKVKFMTEMFKDATSFNQDIGKWKFPEVEYMNEMFAGATSFNQDIGKWEFPKVNDMSDMFKGATSFNQPIGEWKFPEVNDMSEMFGNASSFNQPIGEWKFPKVEFMISMFEGAISFNQDISKWNVNSDIDVTDMFKNCPIKDEHKPKKFRK